MPRQRRRASRHLVNEIVRWSFSMAGG